MRTVQIFEKGEKVGLEMVIEQVALENGEVKYKLKDPRSQKDYPYIFSSNELFALEKGDANDGESEKL